MESENLYQDLIPKLAIDCQECSGLCCVSLYFAKSEGFPKDKAPGEPCANLGADFRCKIHDNLFKNKFKGCLAYDCFGAGQWVTRQIYGGQINWRNSPEQAQELFAVFLNVRQLHQMLWYLIQAAMMTQVAERQGQIQGLILENTALTQKNPEEICALDLDAYRLRVNQILKEAWAEWGTPPKGQLGQTQGQDFIGKNFKKANLEARDFSMAWLMAANLRGCSLGGANFLGADLRDTDLRDADLRTSLFLTQGQINSAKGNAQTKLPPMLTPPPGWLE